MSEFVQFAHLNFCQQKLLKLFIEFERLSFSETKINIMCKRLRTVNINSLNNWSAGYLKQIKSKIFL